MVRIRLLFPLLIVQLSLGVGFRAEEVSKKEVRRARRESQSHWDLARSVRSLLSQRGGNVQAPPSGYSYVTFVPFVAKDDNTRTNVGLNNFSQVSFVKGTNPSANVRVILLDELGSIAGQHDYVVKSNELLQINDVVSSLGGNDGNGWLIVFSDEPLTAWASVILNSTNDPSIELAISSGGSRLMIQSSVKTGTFQSSLIINNIGDAVNVDIKIYRNDGTLLTTQKVFIEALGLYVNNDVRSSASGTSGPIVVEAENNSAFLIANSIVTSANGTGAFFPAFALPPASLTSIAGIWEGPLTGTLINAQVTVTLLQEGTLLFGEIEIVSGSFPTAQKTISIHGSISNDGTSDSYSIEAIDTADSTVTSFSFSLTAPPITGSKMAGQFTYSDAKGQEDTGTFSLSRTGNIYSQQ
jgi:hypothetical protein